MEGDTVKGFRDKFETLDTPEISRPNTNHSNDKTRELTTTAEKINKFNTATSKDSLCRKDNARDVPSYKGSKSLVRQMTTKLNDLASSHVKERCRSTERTKNCVIKHPNDADEVDTNSQNRMSTTPPSSKPIHPDEIYVDEIRPDVESPIKNIAYIAIIEPQNQIPVPLLSPNSNYTNEMQSDVIRPPNKDDANTTLTDPENRMSIPLPPPMPTYTIEATALKHWKKNVANSNLQNQMSIPVFSSPSEDMNEVQSDVIRRPNKNAENTTDKVNGSSKSILGNTENFRQDNASSSDGVHRNYSGETIKHSTTAERINKLKMATSKDRLTRTASVRDVTDHKRSKSLVRQMTTKLNGLASSHVREHCRSSEKINNNVIKHPIDADAADTNSQNPMSTLRLSPKPTHLDEIQSDVKCLNKNVADTALPTTKSKLNDSSKSVLSNSKTLGQDNASASGGVHENDSDETTKLTTTAEKNNIFNMATSKDWLNRTASVRDVAGYKGSRSLVRQMTSKLNELTSSHVKERYRSSERTKNDVIKHCNDVDAAETNSQNRTSTPSPSPKAIYVDEIQPDVESPNKNVTDIAFIESQKLIPAPLLSPNPNYTNEMQSDVIESPSNDIANTTLTSPENRILIPPPPPMPTYTIEAVAVIPWNKNVARRNLQEQMSVPVIFSPPEDMNEVHSDVITRPSKNAENTTGKLNDSSKSILCNSKYFGQDNANGCAGVHRNYSDETIKHSTTAERINKFNTATSKDRLTRTASVRDVPDYKRSKSLVRQMTTKLNGLASSHVREHCRSSEKINSNVIKHPIDADVADTSSQNQTSTPPPSPKTIYVDEILPDVESSNKNIANIAFIEPQHRIPAPPLSPNPNYTNEMQADIIKPPKKDVANSAIIDPENRMSTPPPSPKPIQPDEILSGIESPNKNVANNAFVDPESRISTPTPSPKPIYVDEILPNVESPNKNVGDIACIESQDRIPASLLSPNHNYTNEMQSDVIRPPNKDVTNTTLTDPENRMPIPPSPPMPTYTIEAPVLKHWKKSVANSYLQNHTSATVFFSPSEDMNKIHSELISRQNKNAQNTADELNESSKSILSNSENFRQDNASASDDVHKYDSDETIKHSTTAERINKLQMATSKDRLTRTASVRDVTDHKRSKSLVRQMTTKLNGLASSHVREHCRSSEKINNNVIKHPIDADVADTNSQNRNSTPLLSSNPIHPDEIQSDVKCPNRNVADTTLIDPKHRISTPPPSPKPVYVDGIPPDAESPNKNVANIAFIEPENPILAPLLSPDLNYPNEMQSDVIESTSNGVANTTLPDPENRISIPPPPTIATYTIEPVAVKPWNENVAPSNLQGRMSAPVFLSPSEDVNEVHSDVIRRPNKNAENTTGTVPQKRRDVTDHKRSKSLVRQMTTKLNGLASSHVREHCRSSEKINSNVIKHPIDADVANTNSQNRNSTPLLSSNPIHPDEIQSDVKCPNRNVADTTLIDPKHRISTPPPSPKPVYVDGIPPDAESPNKNVANIAFIEPQNPILAPLLSPDPNYPNEMQSDVIESTSNGVANTTLPDPENRISIPPPPTIATYTIEPVAVKPWNENVAASNLQERMSAPVFLSPSEDVNEVHSDVIRRPNKNAENTTDKLNDKSKSILNNRENLGQVNISTSDGVHKTDSDETRELTTTAETINKSNMATSKEWLASTASVRDLPDYKRSKSLVRQMTTKLNGLASSHVREHCRSSEKINSNVIKHPIDADVANTNSQNRNSTPLLSSNPIHPDEIQSDVKCPNRNVADTTLIDRKHRISTPPPSPKPDYVDGILPDAESPDKNVANIAFIEPQNLIPAPLLSPDPNYTNEMQSDVMESPINGVANTTLPDPENRISIPPPPPISTYTVEAVAVKPWNKNVARSNLQERMSTPAFLSPSEDVNEVHSDVIRRPNKNTEDTTDKLNDNSKSILNNSENFGQDNISTSDGVHKSDLDENRELTTTAERTNKFNTATSKERLASRASVRDVPDYKRSKSLVRQMTTKLNELASSHVREHCRSSEKINSNVIKHPIDADVADTNSQNRNSTPLLSSNPIHPDEIQSDVKCPNRNVADTTLIDPKHRISTSPPSPKPVYVDGIPPDVESPNKNVANIAFIEPQNPILAPLLSPDPIYPNEMQSDVIESTSNGVANTKLPDPENRISIPPPPTIATYTVEAVAVKPWNENVALSNLQERMSAPVFLSPSEDVNEVHSNVIRRPNKNTENTTDKLNDKSKSILNNRENLGQVNISTSDGVHKNDSDKNRELTTTAERINKFNTATSKERLASRASDRDLPDYKRSKSLVRQMTTKLNGLASSHVREHCRSSEKINSNVIKHPIDADVANTNSQNRNSTPLLSSSPIHPDEIQSDVKCPNRNVADTTLIDRKHRISTPPPSPKPDYVDGILPDAESPNKNVANIAFIEPQNLIPAPLLSPDPNYTNEMQSDVMESPTNGVANTTLPDPENRISIPPPPTIATYTIEPVAVKPWNENVAPSNLQERMSAPVFLSPSEDVNAVHSDVIRRPNKNAGNTTDKLNDKPKSILNNSETLGQDNISTSDGVHKTDSDETRELTTTAETINKSNMATSKERLASRASVRDVPDYKRSKSLVRQMTTKLNGLASSHVREHCRSSEKINSNVIKHPIDADVANTNSQNRNSTPLLSSNPIHPDEIQSDVKCPNRNVADTTLIDRKHRISTPPPSPKPDYVDGILPDAESPNKNVANIAFIEPQNLIPAPLLSPDPNYTNEMQSDVMESPTNGVANTTPPDPENRISIPPPPPISTYTVEAVAVKPWNKNVARSNLQERMSTPAFLSPSEDVNEVHSDVIGRPNKNTENTTDKLNDKPKSILNNSETLGQDNISTSDGVHKTDSDETRELTTTAETINKSNMATSKEWLASTASVRDVPDYKRSKSLVRQMTTKLNELASSHVKEHCRSSEKINNNVIKHPIDADVANTDSQNRTSTLRPSPKPIHVDEIRPDVKDPNKNVANIAFIEPQNRIPGPLFSPNPNYTNEMQSDVIGSPSDDVANTRLTDPESRMSIPPSVPIEGVAVKPRNKNVANSNLQKRMSVPVFFSPSEDVNEVDSDVLRCPNKHAEDITDKLSDSSKSILCNSKNVGQDNASAFDGVHINSTDETIRHTTTAERINKFNTATSKEWLTSTASVRNVSDHKGSKSLARDMTTKLNELASSHLKERCKSTESINNYVIKHPNDAHAAHTNSQNRMPNLRPSPKPIHLDEIQSDVKCLNKNVADTALIDPQNRISTPPPSPKPIYVDKIQPNVENPKKNVANIAFIVPQNRISAPVLSPNPNYTNEMQFGEIKLPNKDVANSTPTDPENRTSIPPPPPMPMYNILAEHRDKDVANWNLQKRMTGPSLPPRLTEINRTQSCLPDVSEALKELFQSNNSVANSSQNTDRVNVSKSIGIATRLIETSSKLHGDSEVDTRRQEPLSNEDEGSGTQYEKIGCEQMELRIERISQQLLKRSNTCSSDEKPTRTTSLFVIQELLQTELAYFQGLQTVYKEYIVYFKTSDILCGCDIRKIFRNFEDIYKNQCDFYIALAECNNDIDDIAETFLKNKRLFDFYKDYILRYPSSHEHLTGQCSDAIKARDQELGNELGLQSFLAAPLQRLIRYRLILKTLEDALEKDNASSAKLRVTVAYLDDLIEGIDLQAKLMVDKHISLNEVYMKYGTKIVCSWKNNGKKYNGTIIIFEGLVFFTKKARGNKVGKSKGTIPLEDLRIYPLAEEEKAFQLLYVTGHKLNHNGRYVYDVFVETAELKRYWVRKIEDILSIHLLKCKNK